MAPRLQIVIGAKDEASRPIASISDRLEALGATAAGVGRTMAIGLAGGVAGLSAAFVGSVRTAADFEQALANTRAATGATADQMAKLREEALGIGKDTSKSASEAAEAMGELVKAGLPVEKVINGAARAVVQLAEATGSDVTEMAVLTSNALNTFKASGIDAAGVAELVARAANASAIGTGEIATALQAVGPVAAQAGLSMEDFATAIGIMGNNALKGSDAGTSLKTMLMRLTAPSDEAKDALRRFGIQAYDSQGQVRPFRDILSQLQTAFSDGAMVAADNSTALKDLEKAWQSHEDAVNKLDPALEKNIGRQALLKRELDELITKHGADSLQVARKRLEYDQLSKTIGNQQAELENRKSMMGLLGQTMGQLQKQEISVTEAVRNSALAQIFGADAIRASNILLGEGVKGWDAFKGALAGAPSLAEQSAMRLKTLNGVIEQIRGSLETLAINIGSRALPAITELAEVALQAVNGDFSGAWERTHKVITEAIPKVREAATQMLNGIRSWISDTAAPVITARLGEWRAAFVNWVGPAWEGLRRNLENIGRQVWNWITTTGAPQLRDKLGEWSRAFQTWLDATWPDLERNLNKLLGDVGIWIDRNSPTIAAHLEKWSAEFANWAKLTWGQNGEKLDAITDGIADWMATKGYEKTKSVFQGMFKDLGKDLAESASGSGGSAAEHWSTGFIEGLKKQFSDPQTALQTLTRWNETIQNFALGPLFGPGSTLFKAIVGYFERIGADALRALVKQLIGIDLPGFPTGGGGSGFDDGGGANGGTTPPAVGSIAGQAASTVRALMDSTLIAGTTAGSMRARFGQTAGALSGLVSQANAIGQGDLASRLNRFAGEGLSNLISDALRGMSDSQIVGQGRSYDLFNGLMQVFNAWVAGQGIPALADGGIVTRPTLAMVGERGPEAVIPLGRGGAGNTYVLNFNQPIYGFADFRDQVLGAMVMLERQGSLATGVTR